jgi:hypothetical protein
MAHGRSAGHPASVPQIRSRGARLARTPADDAAILAFTRPDLARGQYRVLLAHDLTGPSEIALVRAGRLALERNGHLTILHVVDNRLPRPTSKNAERTPRAFLRRKPGGGSDNPGCATASRSALESPPMPSPPARKPITSILS